MAPKPAVVYAPFVGVAVQSGAVDVDVDVEVEVDEEASGEVELLKVEDVVEVDEEENVVELDEVVVADGIRVRVEVTVFCCVSVDTRAVVGREVVELHT